MNIKTQRHLSRLIFRYLRDRLNEEESRELERWRAASEAHELLFRRLLSSAHWQRSIGRFVKNESDTQSEWEIIRQRTVGRDRGKRTIRWYRYAAAIFLPLLIASGYFIKLSRTPQEKTLVSVPFIPGKSYAVLELADGTSIDLGETAVRGQIQGGHWEVRSDSLKYCEEGVKGGEEYHTLKVPRGGEYTLVLADGSKVFLNAESSLKYPVLFSGDLRKVKLEGEAYFEVASNPQKLFYVLAGETKVRVLGTAFNVLAYQDDLQTEVALLRGKVSFDVADKAYVLTPGEIATLDRESGKTIIRKGDVAAIVDWKAGRFNFEDMPLEKLTVKLSRWYGVTFIFDDEEAKKLRFSGAVTKYRTLDYMLGMIEKTTDVSFELKEDKVVVSLRK